ncbi:MAG: hypothetical protein VB018_03960 [Lachnospiraceae bacterium]|nr:hypothetical protein [Lachnospiraceae bacterium]
MTATNLLDALKEFIENVTKDLILEVKTKQGEEKQERAPLVFQGILPRKSEPVQHVPYVLIKFLTGKDGQITGQFEESEMKTRVIIVTYSEDNGQGYIDTLNVIDRIRIKLLETRVLNDVFGLKMPVEFTVYDDDTGPYTIGELLLSWDTPTIQREVSGIWQK